MWACIRYLRCALSRSAALDSASSCYLYAVLLVLLSMASSCGAAYLVPPRRTSLDLVGRDELRKPRGHRVEPRHIALVERTLHLGLRTAKWSLLWIGEEECTPRSVV